MNVDMGLMGWFRVVVFRKGDPKFSSRRHTPYINSLMHLPSLPQHAHKSLHTPPGHPMAPSGTHDESQAAEGDPALAIPPGNSLSQGGLDASAPAPTNPDHDAPVVLPPSDTRARRSQAKSAPTNCSPFCIMKPKPGIVSWSSSQPR